MLIGGPYNSNPYGHVALRVIGNGYDYVFDYGRYGEAYGIGRSEGEGQLRIWSDFNRYMVGENATGRTTFAFRYATEMHADKEIISYFESLINNINPNSSKGEYMKQYHIDSYHAVNNNCTTVALEGLQATVIPEDLYNAINDASFNQGRGLSWDENILFYINKDRDGIVLPLDLLESIRNHGGYESFDEYKQ